MKDEQCHSDHIKEALEKAEQICSCLKDQELKSVAFSKILDCLQKRCCAKKNKVLSYQV